MIYVIRTSARTLLAVACACPNPRENPRKVLWGLYVELTPTTARFVATDGKMLLTSIEAAECDPIGEEAENGQFILPLSALTGLKKSDGDISVVFDATAKHGELVCGPRRIEFKPIDATYPLWRDAAPKQINETALASCGISAALMARAQKAAELIGARRVLWVPSGFTPGILDFGCGNITGFAMPVRLEINATVPVYEDFKAS